MRMPECIPSSLGHGHHFEDFSHEGSVSLHRPPGERREEVSDSGMEMTGES